MVWKEEGKYGMSKEFARKPGNSFVSLTFHLLVIDSPCYINYFLQVVSKALAKRSRLFTIQRSTCMLSEMSRAFGHLVE